MVTCVLARHPNTCVTHKEGQTSLMRTVRCSKNKFQTWDWADEYAALILGVKKKSWLMLFAKATMSLEDEK